MTEIKKKLSAVFFIIGAVVIFCLSCLFSAASAEGAGTMTLVCESRGEIAEGMTWSVYRIGSFDGGEIKLEGKFTDYPVDMSDLSSSGLADAASTLKDYAFIYKIEPNGKGVTNSDGRVSFDGLDYGVYLVAANKLKVGDKTFIPTPAIVALDSSQGDDMTVYPKITAIRTLADEYERFSVRKVWERYEGMLVKPTEIVVDIYRDYELYETVKLSVDNDWSYSWEELVGSEWTIIERKIPEKCTVVYRNDGRRYIVVNTYNPEFIFDWGMDYPPPGETTTVTGQVSGDIETNTTTAKSFPIDDGEDTRVSESSTATTEPDSEQNSDTTQNGGNSVTTQKGGNTSAVTTTAENKLPQTGQLWWPVPVMAIIGLIFIAAGGRIICECKRKDNE